MSTCISPAQTIVRALTPERPAAISYRQIEAAIGAAVLDAEFEDTCFREVLDLLDAAGVRVVEHLDAADTWVDEIAEAQDLAQDVWRELKAVQAPIDLYHHRILSASDERRLLEVYRNGRQLEIAQSADASAALRLANARQVAASREAFEELMHCNLRLVVKIAYKYLPRAQHLNLDDLIQEGRIGMQKAIERFDLDANTRLSTYATWWVRQSISRALADQDRTVRLPVHLQERLTQVRRLRTEWLTAYSTEPSAETLATLMDCPVKTVEHVLTWLNDAGSLDQRLSEHVSLGALVAAPRDSNPEQALMDQQLGVVLREALRELEPRQRTILELRFGLGADGERWTLEAVGQKFDLTRERIRQIEVKALKKLGARRVQLHLMPFYEER